MLNRLWQLAQIKYVNAKGTGSEQIIEQIDYGYDASRRAPMLP